MITPSLHDENYYNTLIDRYVPARHTTAHRTLVKDGDIITTIGIYEEHIIMVPSGYTVTVCDEALAFLTTVIIGEGAVIHYSTNISPDTISRQYHFYAGESSSMHAFFSGAPTGAVTIKAILDAPHATVKIGVAVTVHEQNQITFSTEQLHSAPHTTSALKIRKIVFDSAQAIYRGMISVTKDAMHAQAAQDDRTLLDGILSRAESVPAIEVQQDAVQCAHGSAVGRLDELQLWYLITRGLEHTRATKLCYEAFLKEV
jgi:Fe-S cluster assembly scaffold protein SufB